MTYRHRSRRLRFGLSAILIAIIAASVVAAVSGIRVVSVLSPSMTPSYSMGSMVITKPVRANELNEGDVIAFAPPAPFVTPHKRPVLHRINSLETKSGDVIVTTKGDANDSPDPWRVSLQREEAYRTIGSAPFVGWVTGALTSADLGPRAIAILGLVLMAGAFVCWPRSDCKCCEKPIVAM